MIVKGFKSNLIIGFLIAVSILVLFFYLRNDNRPRITTDLSHPTVVKEIRKLGRLETAQFTMEKVIDTQITQSNAIKELLFGDRILLIAHGQVIGGVNLENLPEKAVAINGSVLTITLPDTELFSTNLDSNHTRIFDRKLGLLTRGDLSLESEARKSAEGALQAGACEAGILEEARIGAEERMKQLYTIAGFSEVIVIVKAGSC